MMTPRFPEPGRATASTPEPRTPPFKVFNAEGRPFHVLLVRKGERFGRNGCLVHRGDVPLVEFYDAAAKPAFGPLGQYAQGYYASTLTEAPPRGGLALVVHVREWTLDGCAVEQVLRWLAATLAAPVAS